MLLVANLLQTARICSNFFGKYFIFILFSKKINNYFSAFLACDIILQPFTFYQFFQLMIFIKQLYLKTKYAAKLICSFFTLKHRTNTLLFPSAFVFRIGFRFPAHLFSSFASQQDLFYCR